MLSNSHAATTTRVSKMANARRITAASLVLAVTRVAVGKHRDRPELRPFRSSPVTDRG